MIAFTKCNSGVTLVRRIIVINALDSSSYDIFANLFGEPEHTLCITLLHEYSRDHAFFAGDFNNSAVKIFSVLLVEERYLTCHRIDEHEADVGNFAALECNSHSGSFGIIGSFTVITGNIGRILGFFHNGLINNSKNVVSLLSYVELEGESLCNVYSIRTLESGNHSLRLINSAFCSEYVSATLKILLTCDVDGEV